MPEATLQVMGGMLGGLVAHVIVWQVLFGPKSGEAAIADAMLFWMGGCLVIPVFYFVGMTVGIFGAVPLAKACCAIVRWIRQRPAGED